jgi:hypothetical protein
MLSRRGTERKLEDRERLIETVATRLEGALADISVRARAVGAAYNGDGAETQRELDRCLDAHLELLLALREHNWERAAALAELFPLK